MLLLILNVVVFLFSFNWYQGSEEKDRYRNTEKLVLRSLGFLVEKY